MNTTFFVGLTGALILVAGAAYPIKHVSHPAKEEGVDVDSMRIGSTP